MWLFLFGSPRSVTWGCSTPPRVTYMLPRRQGRLKDVPFQSPTYNERAVTDYMYVVCGSDMQLARVLPSADVGET